MSDPTLLSPPEGGDQDLGPRFLSLVWVEGCIATVIVALRFYTRYVYAKRTAWDDWMMFITLVRVQELNTPCRLFLQGNDTEFG